MLHRNPWREKLPFFSDKILFCKYFKSRTYCIVIGILQAYALKLSNNVGN